MKEIVLESAIHKEKEVVLLNKEQIFLFFSESGCQFGEVIF